MFQPARRLGVAVRAMAVAPSNSVVCSCMRLLCSRVQPRVGEDHRVGDRGNGDGVDEFDAVQTRIIALAYPDDHLRLAVGSLDGQDFLQTVIPIDVGGQWLCGGTAKSAEIGRYYGRFALGVKALDVDRRLQLQRAAAGDDRRQAMLPRPLDDRGFDAEDGG